MLKDKLLYIRMLHVITFTAKVIKESCEAEWNNLLSIN